MVEKSTRTPTTRQDYLNRVTKLIGAELVFKSTGNDRLNCHSCRRRVEANERYVRCTVASNDRDKKCNSTWHAERICLGPEKYSDDEMRCTEPNPANDGPFKMLEPENVQWACPICRDICKESRCIMKRSKAAAQSDTSSERATGRDNSHTITLPIATPFESSSTSESPQIQALNLSNTTPSPSPAPSLSTGLSALAVGSKTKGKNTENEDPDAKSDITTASAKKQGIKRKAATLKEDKTAKDKDSIKPRKRSSLNPNNIEGQPSVKKRSSLTGLRELVVMNGKGLPTFMRDPNFQFIQVDFSDDEFNSRLFIREFIVKFGKSIFGIQQTHLKAADNPNQNWKPSFFKTAITHLLEYVNEDAWFDDDQITDCVKLCLQNVKKHPADSPKMWIELRDMLEHVSKFTKIPIKHDWQNVNVESSADRVKLFEGVIGILITGEIFRQHLKDTDKRVKHLLDHSKAEIKEERRRYIESAERHKEDVKKASFDDTDALQIKFSRDTEHHLRSLQNMELQNWLAVRKIDYRHAEPLGMDILGNIYSVYTPLVDGADGWGNWVICCKAENLVHPLGYLPSTAKTPKRKQAPSPPSDDSSSSPPDAHEKDYTWYAVDGAKDIQQLSQWIKYRAEKTWSEIEEGTFQTPVKKHKPVGRPKKNDFSIFVDKINSTKTFNPREVITKESIEELCGKLDTVSSMLGAYDAEVRLKKVNGLL